MRISKKDKILVVYGKKGYHKLLARRGYNVVSVDKFDVLEDLSLLDEYIDGINYAVVEGDGMGIKRYLRKKGVKTYPLKVFFD